MELNQRHEEAQNNVDATLSKEIPGDLDEPKLLEMSKTVKELYHTCSTASKEVFTKLLLDGATAEAQTLRQSRYSTTERVQEYIGIINSYLKKLSADTLSNIDALSIASQVGEEYSIGGDHYESIADGGEIQTSSPLSNEEQNCADYVNSVTSHSQTGTNIPVTSSSAAHLHSNMSTAATQFSNILTPHPPPHYSTATHPIMSTTIAPSMSQYNPVTSMSQYNPVTYNSNSYSNIQPLYSHVITPPLPLYPSYVPQHPFRYMGSGTRGTFDSSQHSLVHELEKLNVSTFDGAPQRFWSWHGQVQQKLSCAPVTPLQMMQYLQQHTKGQPNEMISRHLDARGEITHEDVDQIWTEFKERFGSPERIARDLISKLKQFPVVKGNDLGSQLLHLYDLCSIIKFNLTKNQHLQIMNLDDGQRIVRSKLPSNLQEDWRTIGATYSLQNEGNYPPFAIFLQFLKEKSRILASAHFDIITCDTKPVSARRGNQILKTSVEYNKAPSIGLFCAFHKKPGHQLSECKTFRRLTYHERKTKLIELKLCFKCVQPHFASDCNTNIRCKECNQAHATSMHVGSDVVDSNHSTHNARVMCTTICGDPTRFKNCSKTVLVDLTMDAVPHKKLRCYAILDDHSTVSLIDSKVIQFFGKDFPTRDFTLGFATKLYEVHKTGQVVTGMKVNAIKTNTTIALPELLENQDMADTKHEVACPEIVRAHSHIAHLASEFNDLDDEAQVLILIGRNCADALLAEPYSKTEPIAYKTPLGFALVGKTCITEDSVIQNRVMKTSCCSSEHIKARTTFPSKPSTSVMEDPFETANDDEDTGLSTDDRRFLQIMSSEVCINQQGKLQLPIPFKDEAALPKNKQAVFHRSKNTLLKLKRDPIKLKACLNAMQKSISVGHIESVPENESVSTNRCWWLPIFPVFNEKKNKTRLVFDASAKYQGISLNDSMLQGPDFNNNLRGVLLRFRERTVAFVSDIESMYNAFDLPPEQKDLYRFFWFRNNDSAEDIIEYRSTSHLFGSRSSPAIANYGLKYTTSHEVAKQHPYSAEFIRHGFYVDDGIFSADTVDDAINIIKGARKILSKFNIRLHKILCNSEAVLQAFPTSETAHGTHAITCAEAPTTRTLGVAWDAESDYFFIQVDIPVRPFTKRGVLAVVNAVYDPIGMASPVILTGRLIQRAVLPPKAQCNPELLGCGWDDPLPQTFLEEFRKWQHSLVNLTKLRLERCFTPANFKVKRQEIHTYVDASEKAIGHVIYLRSVDKDDNVYISFVYGDSKVAPRAAGTIPRLELCAAVHACQSTNKVTRELSRKPDASFFYSDSRITLSYIANQHRRFSSYVSRRIHVILNHSKVEQWFYVPTSQNPADIASRPHFPNDLLQTRWITGPAELWSPVYSPTPEKPTTPAEQLPGFKEDGTILRTAVRSPSESPITAVFSQISVFRKAIKVVARILRLLYKLDISKQRLGISLAPRQLEVPHQLLMHFIVLHAQHDCFHNEIALLKNNMSLPENSSISDLAPFLDCSGTLRVGGRLKHANMAVDIKHPRLLPAIHPISTALINHIHAEINHQGLLLTHGAVRERGFHFQNGRQLIRKMIKQCVTCRKLRAPTLDQIMADLPPDRVEEVPPFSNVGIDCFGPYLVHDGKSTRRTKATKKVWGLIIVCLASRAVHIEMLPSMDTGSFRNALSRFTAVRGICKLIRSDQGTQFMCARKQLQTQEIDTVIKELQNYPYEWKLNPPGASHFAGSWERKIGSIKRVLDGSLMLLNHQELSRDELSTLLQEAAAIVNNTPLADVSPSADDPLPISPANLLTLKQDPNPPPLERFTSNDILSYGTRRWRRCQVLAEEFWRRWKNEYIQQLQTRHKWKTVKPCPAIGDIVLVKEKNSPRNRWPIAKICSVKCSDDGQVRSVTLKLPPLQGSSALRSVSKCIQDLVLIYPHSQHGCL